MKSRAIFLVVLAGAFVAACGGAAAPAQSSAPAAPSAAATGTPASASPGTTSAKGSAWTIASASKATVSVREQLVGVSLPSDAVLTATGVTGAFGLNADGTFTSDSKISIDLTTLASDQRDRDNFIKNSTLQVRQYPTATFVPKRATGLRLPLPSGDVTFTLAGAMTVHGVTKDVTFDVVAKQSGGQLTAIATARPDWTFGDFGMTAPSVPFRVVSVTDDIRLVIEIVADAGG